MPLAGVELPNVQKKKWNERTIDEMFCGYSRSVETPNDGLSEKIREYMHTHIDLTYEVALEKCIEEQGLSYKVDIKEALVKYMSVAVDEMDKLPILVKGVLAMTEEEVNPILDSAYKKAKAGHLWDNRVKEVLELFTMK